MAAAAGFTAVGAAARAIAPPHPTVVGQVATGTTLILELNITALTLGLKVPLRSVSTNIVVVLAACFICQFTNASVRMASKRAIFMLLVTCVAASVSR